MLEHVRRDMLVNASFFRFNAHCFLNDGFVDVMTSCCSALQVLGMVSGRKNILPDGIGIDCLSHAYFTWVPERASVCFVVWDKFAHPVGIRFCGAGGIVPELDSIAQLIE